MNKGFTLIELMVAMFIFTLIVAAAANFLLSATSSQRSTLTTQKTLSESSTIAEYMARAVRSAKKELNNAPQNCLTTVGRGYNYELNNDLSRVRFLDRQNLCHEFFLSSSKIQERISADDKAQNFGQAQDLTSSNVSASILKFSLLGENQTDSLQPRVTISFQLDDVLFQTTVSQRNFDVEK